jgi:folate-binding protein YgfZ
MDAPTVSSPRSLGAGRSRSREEIAREYNAIKSSVGYCRLDDRILIRVSGDDRVSFMHGMCTADIKGMTIGQVAPALFVTERAHIIRDFYVYALADALLIEIDREAWPNVRAHLEKFLVADDVEMEEQTDVSVISCEGPASAERLSAAGLAPTSLVAWHCATDGRFAHVPRLGETGFTLLAQLEEAAGLLARLADARLMEVGSEAHEIVRVEQGLARVGVDTTDKTLALEARFEPSISFNKGCYIGQETIERATARGGIKRRLFGLRVESHDVLPDGASIMLADKPVGVLTSVVESPAYGVIGLAIIQHSAWEEGTHVRLIGTSESTEGSACITNLPFANE